MKNYSEVKRYVRRHALSMLVIEGRQGRAAFMKGFQVGRDGDHISTRKPPSGELLFAYQEGWKVGLSVRGMQGE